MSIMFTIPNWNRFFDGHNKKTTIRTKQIRKGHHSVLANIKLGELDIVNVEERTFGTLTEQDAKDDGFDNLEELRKEICNLKDGIAEITPLWKHWIENVKATADNTNFKTASPKLKHS